MTDIWTLPGPAAFLAGVLDDLRAGVSVHIEAPQTVDEYALADAVRSAFSYLEMSLPDASAESPFRAVCQALSFDDGQMPATIHELAVRATDEDQLLWVSATGLSAASRAQWLAFADELAQAVDGQGGHLPVVLFSGGDCDTVESADSPRIRARPWWAVLSRLDISVFVAGLDGSLDEIRREEIAALAGDDLELATELVSGAPTRGAATEICAARARTLGFDPDGTPISPAQCSPKTVRGQWLNGSLQIIDGNAQVHAGVHAIRANSRAIEQRRWASQIRSVMPQMDLLRVRLLELAVERGAIASWRAENDAVEFKDVHWALRKRRELREQAELASWLHAARNRLSHLESLTDDEIRDGKVRAAKAGYRW